jgi:hypothetical protein
MVCCLCNNFHFFMHRHVGFIHRLRAYPCHPQLIMLELPLPDLKALNAESTPPREILTALWQSLNRAAAQAAAPTGPK